VELQFRIAGIPVQVSLLFFLIVFLLRPRDEGPAIVLVWVALAFVGVLAHELGHALVARKLGETPRIALHGMGGVTFWRPRRVMSAGQRVAIAAAGPGVGVTAGALAWLAGALTGLHDRPGPAATALELFVWVNLGWGLFNLLPMQPLDGGAIVAAALEGLLGPAGRTGARVLSIVCALLVALLLFAGGAWIGALLCLFFVYTNVQGLRADRAGPSAVSPAAPTDVREP
jgi:Zn-dependent protease